MSIVTAFSSPNKENGYLSQWWKCKFVDQGYEFSSVGQYIAWYKAVTFNQLHAAQMILGNDDKLPIRRIERSAGLKDWDRYDIVYRANKLKFSQNPDLLARLIATGNNIIGYISRCDMKWGTGSEAKIYYNRWKGQNLLGRILMDVRRDLQSTLYAGQTIPYNKIYSNAVYLSDSIYM